MAFSTDNRYLWVSRTDESATVRDLLTLKVVKKFKHADISASVGALKPNAERLISSTKSGLFHVYNLAADKPERLLSIALFCDSQKLFVFTPDGYYDGPAELAERCFAYVKGLESLQGEQKKQMLEYYRKPGLARERLKK